MLIAQVRYIFKRFPVTRGMATYGLLWPCSELSRQLTVQKSHPNERRALDYSRIFCFSCFGALWVAPTLYCWVRIAGKVLPGSSMLIAMVKAGLDQIVYSPFSIITFYWGMSVLEGHTNEEAIEEVKSKLIPTWKAAASVWPIVQTFNFAFVPERNRVVVTGMVSFIWTVYLSFMQAKSKDDYND